MLKEILTPQNLVRGTYRKGHSMQIYEVFGVIFLEVKSHRAEGNIIEVLKCSDRKQGLFKLLSRTVENRVPISTVVSRHDKFPMGCTVRLQKTKPKLILPPKP